MSCVEWVEETNALCGKTVFSGGLCKEHYEATKKVDLPDSVPSAAIQWTRVEVKAKFGAVSSFGRDKTGGQYLGGGVDDFHVHVYNDNGAHVKVGNDTYVFLRKPDWAFDEDNWKAGVVAVKAKGGKTDILLGAMAMTLVNYGRVSGHELAKVLGDL